MNPLSSGNKNKARTSNSVMLLLFAALCLFAALNAKSLEPKNQPRYILLVFERLSTRIATDEEPSTWATTVFRAGHSRQLSGLFVYDGSRVGSLKTTRHEIELKTSDRYQEKLDFTYETLDFQEPGSPAETVLTVGDSDPTVLKDSQFETHNSVNIRGIDQQCIALETTTDTPGCSEYHKDRSLQHFEDAELSEIKFTLPGPVIKQALHDFDLAGAGQNHMASHGDGCDPNEYTACLTPSRDGLMAEFVFQPGYGDGFFYSDVIAPMSLLPESKRQNAFVANHKMLIPWKTTPFYSVAPDGSQIAWINHDGTLSCKNAATKQTTKIGKFENFAGLQWVKLTMLKESSRKYLEAL